MKPTKPTSPAKIVPPESWSVNGNGGFQQWRDPKGVTVDLVSLYDVAAFLMQRYPLKTAVTMVCDAIEKHGLDGVYTLQDGTYAEPADVRSEWEQFVGVRTPQKLAEDLKKVLLMESWELERLVNVPECKELEFDRCKETPFEYFGRRGKRGADFAVPHALAHKLWGWGTVAGADKEADSVTQASKVQRVVPTDAAVLEIWRKFESEKANNPTQLTAKHFNISESKVKRCNKAAKEAENAAKSAASVTANNPFQLAKTLNSA